MPAIYKLLTGEELGKAFFDYSPVWHTSPQRMRQLARGVGSYKALLPLPMAFGDDVIATVRTENGTEFYTTGNLAELLKKDDEAVFVADDYEYYLKGNGPNIRFPPKKVPGRGRGER